MGWLFIQVLGGNRKLPVNLTEILMLTRFAKSTQNAGQQRIGDAAEAYLNGNLS